MNKKLYILATFVFGISGALKAQTFEQVSSNLDFFITFGYLTTADLDNDGDLEIIVTGGRDFRIFNNSNGLFEQPTLYPQWSGESQIYAHTLDVGDIDRDGFIDILQSGGPNYRVFEILQNTHPGFNNIADNYLNGLAGTSFLGDYDGDGDLDVVYSGVDNFGNYLGGVALNRDDKLIPGPWFPSSRTWFATWSNLDDDSNLEVLYATGDSYSSTVESSILKNGYPSMSVSKNLGKIPLIYDARFADYDNDGDLDMLARQYPNKLYKNVDGSFIDTGITFPSSKTIDFGDMNNDGLYDVIVGGMASQIYETGIYINQGDGTFTKLEIQIPSCENCASAITDIDGDGDLDIASVYGVYKNNVIVSNEAPTIPVITGNVVSGSSVKLSWLATHDDKTPAKSLTYNISVRSADGTIVKPSHSLASGKRQICAMGNAYNNLSYDLNCLKPGTYYWKVQALDASYLGSEFSTEQSFVITQVAPTAPASLTATPVSDASVDLSWIDQSMSEDEFIIYRRNSGSVFDFYPVDTVPANSTHYTDSYALYANTTYDYKVVASNCAYPEEFASEVSVTTFPPAFVNSNWINLGAVEGSMVLLGDYDNDEDLDMLLSYSGSRKTKLFRFDGPATGYVDSQIDLPFTASGAKWIDYNNDGYLDIFFSNGRLYKNVNATSFTQVTTSGLPDSLTWFGSLAFIDWQAGVSWGDYDNDGDEDMLVQHGSLIQIYDNNGKGIFTRNIKINLTGYLKSNHAWADYDRDGDLDILASQKVSCTSYIMTIFENDGNQTFSPIPYSNLPGLNDDYFNYTGDMKWGDFDNDGYPDIVISGQTTCGNGLGITTVYHNNGNKTFSSVSNLVRGIYDVNVDWGDYDNDGDLDIFLYGDAFGGYSNRSRIYRNDRTTFVETNIDYLLESNQYGKAARGDIDNDGDLDYVILGETDYVNQRIIVYRNTYSESWYHSNTKPSAPTFPQSNVTGQNVTLSWNPSHDQETEQSGITYNIYVVNEADTLVINSYSLVNGTRKITETGNVKSGNTFILKKLKPGTYRWGVQAIDKGFRGSAFSAENTFVIHNSPTTGMDDHTMETVSIFPNPVTNQLTVALAEPENKTELVITNSMGQQVLQCFLTQAESNIDVSVFPSGIYIVAIFRNNGMPSAIKKIVKH